MGPPPAKSVPLEVRSRALQLGSQQSTSRRTWLTTVSGKYLTFTPSSTLRITRVFQSCKKEWRKLILVSSTAFLETSKSTCLVKKLKIFSSRLATTSGKLSWSTSRNPLSWSAQSTRKPNYERTRSDWRSGTSLLATFRYPRATLTMQVQKNTKSNC